MRIFFKSFFFNEQPFFKFELWFENFNSKKNCFSLNLIVVFHTLSNYRISLYIDDEECGTLRFTRKVHSVRAPTNGGLYIGGIPLPTGFQPTEELEIRQPFDGTIKDLVFNRKLMDLNRKIFLNSTF